ncbi:MAG TPA: prolipoprotein diacylglyceryl transferase family protein [Dermatophilaceae bacterium]
MPNGTAHTATSSACPGTTTNILGTFQPTFLYESLWCLLVALALVLVDRRFSLARGQVFALYGMLYTIGRCLIEMLRTDPANYVLGLRLNVWTSVIVFAGSAFAFWRLGMRSDAPGAGVGGLQEPGADEPAAEEPGTSEPAAGEPGADTLRPSQHSE